MTAHAELLDVYRAAILRMQQQLRRMPSVSMASLNFSLQEFKAGISNGTTMQQHLSMSHQLPPLKACLLLSARWAVTSCEQKGGLCRCCCRLCTAWFTRRTATG